MRSTNEADHARVRIPPPVLPAATILAGFLLQRIWPIGSGEIPGAWLQWVGIGLTVVASLVLGAWPLLLLLRSGQNPEPWKPTPRIVEVGPYRVTRNPMYLWMVLVCVGVALAFAIPWILILAPACACGLHKVAILPEEAYMDRRFGEAYRAYRRRVRRWI